MPLKDPMDGHCDDMRLAHRCSALSEDRKKGHGRAGTSPGILIVNVVLK
jgi:hypothetical protein